MSSMLRAAAAVAAVTLASAEPCCRVCELPKVRYYSVDRSHGHCGECCLDPKHYSLFHFFESNLTVAGHQHCADFGYGIYEKTETHGAGPISVELDMYNPSHELSAMDTVTLYKITAGECGQATLDQKFEKQAEAFAGLSEGKCTDQGYTVAAGSKDLTVPVIGQIVVELFKKPAALDMMQLFKIAAAPMGMVTLYRIEGPACAQATIDKKLELDAIVKAAKLTEGKCEEQGFDTSIGKKTEEIPILGEITLELFAKLPLAVQVELMV